MQVSLRCHSIAAMGREILGWQEVLEEVHNQNPSGKALGVPSLCRPARSTACICAYRIGHRRTDDNQMIGTDRQLIMANLLTNNEREFYNEHEFQNRKLLHFPVYWMEYRPPAHIRAAKRTFYPAVILPGLRSVDARWRGTLQ